MFQSYSITSENNEAVTEFTEKFMVEKEHVICYLKHIELLDLKKRKWADKKVSDKQIRVDDIDDTDDNASSQIIAVIGSDTDSSSSDSEEEIQVLKRTRGGRKCTTFRTRHFFGDSE